MSFTFKDKQKAAEREARMRQRVYPRLVERGQLTEQSAKDGIAIMQAIADDYAAAAKATESQRSLL